MKASASPTQKQCSPLLRRPSLEDPLRVWVEPQHEAGQTHVRGDELQAALLVRAAQVIVALFVDLDLHKAVVEAVEHVGALKRAAAGHGAVPHQLRGALAQPREAPLQLGQDEVLLADLELGAVGVLGGETAPAQGLAFRASEFR